MLSEFDLEIVHALQEAPRAPWSLLAGVLATDARTIARRYDRLRADGHVRVSATLGPRWLERVSWAHLRVRTLPGQARHVARQLAAWPQTGSVRVTDGSYEVYALLTGVDGRALWRSTQDGIARIPQIVRADIHTVLESLDIGRAERLDTLSKRQVQQLRSYARLPESDREVTRMTETDLALTAMLNLDGRTEVAACAAELGRSPSSVSRRISRLQADGHLDFMTMIAEPLSSRPLCTFVWGRIDPEELPALRKHRAALHWAGLLTITTGSSNVVVMANVASVRGLESVLSTLRSICPSLEVHETQLSRQAVKRHSRLVTEDELWTDELTDPYPDFHLQPDI